MQKVFACSLIYGTANHHESGNETCFGEKIRLSYYIGLPDCTPCCKATALSTSSYRDRRVFLERIHNAPVVLWIQPILQVWYVPLTSINIHEHFWKFISLFSCLFFKCYCLQMFNASLKRPEGVSSDVGASSVARGPTRHRDMLNLNNVGTTNNLAKPGIFYMMGSHSSSFQCMLDPSCKSLPLQHSDCLQQGPGSL